MQKLDFDLLKHLGVEDMEGLGRIPLDDFVGGPSWISKEQDKLWYNNYLTNYPRIEPVKTSYDGAGRVAVLVGASPAINRQVETFVEISQNKRFFFIVCNGAYKFFLRHGIEPDYVFMIEARPHVVPDINVICEKTRLIHSPYVDPRVLLLWPKDKRECYFVGGGKKYGKILEKHWQSRHDIDIGGGNVVSTSLCWAYKYLNCRDFIFTGMSLCYYDDYYYHDGRDTEHVMKNMEEYKHVYQAMDMHGKIVDTTPPLTMYKAWLETYLRYAQDSKFTNSTEDGILGVYPIPVELTEKKLRYQVGYVPWINIVPLKVAFEGYKNYFKGSE